MRDTKVSSPEEFAAVFNDTNKYHVIADVATALGVAKQTVRNRAASLRRAYLRGDDVPHVINRINTLSENELKFHEEWTADDCINHLRMFAESDPERIITRNWFRNESAISEATWTRYFGTFEEFKRQAGIKAPRNVRKMELSVAHHASIDGYRVMSKERAAYGDKYLFDTNRSRFKTIIAASDLHDIECDRFWLRVFLDTCRRVQPEIINLTGDVFDLPEFGRYTVDPRTWDVVGRIRFVHEKILAPLREACPNAQIDFVEGNHEFRLVKHLADESPAMMAVLSDLHGLNVATLFGLDRFGINYIAKGELAAFRAADMKQEVARNYKIYYETLVAHHYPEGRKMSMPGWNGHHHEHQLWANYTPYFGTYEWHQLGAGHIRAASYCAGERWSNGFAIVNIDTKTKQTNFDYIPVTDFAVSGGQFYHRIKEERFE